MNEKQKQKQKYLVSKFLKSFRFSGEILLIQTMYFCFEISTFIAIQKVFYPQEYGKWAIFS